MGTATKHKYLPVHQFGVGPYLKRLHLTEIDLVILSHSDSDHWKGLEGLFEDESISVAEFWTPGYKDTPLCRATRDYRRFESLAKERADSVKIPLLRADGGTYTPGVATEWREGEGLTVTILSGSPSPPTDLDPFSDWLYGCPYSLNNASAVVRVDIPDKGGSWSFLFTGDANGKRKGDNYQESPIEIEADLLKLNSLDDYMLLPIDVLKVPHHGSNTSSTRDFLRAVFPPDVPTHSRPRFAIVQQHKILGFGPPAASTLEHLREFDLRNVTVLQDFDHIYCYVRERRLKCR